MKFRFIISALLFPVLVFSQKTETYLSILDAGNVQIKGTAIRQRYDNTIIINTLQADAQNPQKGKVSNQISFTMPVTGASGDFRKALSTGRMPVKGDFTILNIGASAVVSTTIRIEDITVLSCTDAIGCNGAMSTTVVLTANRIGWTYYTQDRSGINVVSKKFGWDATLNKEWIGF